MRVALFGGTGFVGSYLVDAMIAAGMQPVLLVRSGHAGKVRHPAECVTLEGDIADMGAVNSLLSQADAAIYNIGILREPPRRGVTFDELHNKAARRVMDAAAQLGVKRFLLMSANGVRPDGTAYQRSKALAEQHVRSTDLDWTIFRPSVIFGAPRGRMEFATQLQRDIIGSHLPAPLFYPGLLPFGAGRFELSPVHVEDVASAFVTALQRPDTIGQTIALGGPSALSWRQILETLAAVAGRRKLMLPVPALSISMAAAMLDRFEDFPITRDQIKMLLEGNVCDSSGLTELGITARPFDISNLLYLNNTDEGPETWHQNAA
jgi:NADH dehydrogenase